MKQNTRFKDFGNIGPWMADISVSAPKKTYRPISDYNPSDQHYTRNTKSTIWQEKHTKCWNSCNELLYRGTDPWATM